MRIKREYQETFLERLSNIRRNILILLRYGRVIPFHWNTRGFKCFFCGKQMKDCDTLKEHTTVDHNSVDLEHFIPQRVISKDVPVKIDVTDMGCKFCNVPLSNVEDLITHIIAVHGEDYDNSIGGCVFPFNLNKNILQCVLCPERYDNFTSILGHMYKQHIFHSHICQICGLGFVDQVRLKRHISNSHVGYRCRICEKVFDAFHKVEKHKQRTHGIHRSVACDLCSATFQNNYQIKVHMGKVHNVEKYRIKCEHCPKICTTKGALVLHVQSMHSDQRFECDLCDYKTGIKWMIKLHKRRHYGEKNYVCSICDKRFGRSSNLRAHMKVHTGSTGRVCRWCRHGFVDLEGLDKHEKEVHYYSQYN